MKKTSIRRLLADIGQQIQDVRTTREGPLPAATLGALEGSWASLVKLLDVGPEPEVRSCPFCGGTIMRAATRCMHCWGKSVASSEHA